MRGFMVGWLCVFSVLAWSSLQAAETVTVGGAVVMIPDGWARADTEGRIILAPKDLPLGVVCTLTLLGGEVFEGSVTDQLDAAWKQMTSRGKIISDDKGKVEGAGKSVEVASRAGTVELNGGIRFHIRAVMLHTNGRIERMILTTNNAAAFDKHNPAVTALIQTTNFVPAAGAGAASAFGHMRYAVPHGWTEKRYTNGVVLAIDNPFAGELLEVRLLTPVPASGKLTDAMAVAWDDVCIQWGMRKKIAGNGGNYAADSPRKSFKGWEYIRATGSVTANAGQVEFYVNLIVIKINDRFERLAILSLMHNHNENRCSLYESPVYRQAIQEFIFGMKFDDWKDAVVEPATFKGDGIVGVWQGISMFGGEFKGSYAIFYSNGQVYFASSFPLAGCDRQHTWIEAEEKTRYWGIYTFQNGAGLIKLPVGNFPIRAKANNLILTTNATDHEFGRVRPVDGARFNGRYVMNPSYEKIPVITFTADGHFMDQGALQALEHDNTNPFRITAAHGGGTQGHRI